MLDKIVLFMGCMSLCEFFFCCCLNGCLECGVLLCYFSYVLFVCYFYFDYYFWFCCCFVCCCLDFVV